MPMRQRGRLAKRTATWLRDSFWRKTMAPLLSKPITWKLFLPISMPMVEMAAGDVFVVMVIFFSVFCAPGLEQISRTRSVHPIIGHFRSASTNPSVQFPQPHPLFLPPRDPWHEAKYWVVTGRKKAPPEGGACLAKKTYLKKWSETWISPVLSWLCSTRTSLECP